MIVSIRRNSDRDSSLTNAHDKQNLWIPHNNATIACCIRCLACGMLPADQPEPRIMTIHALVGNMPKIVKVSIVAVAALGISSCATQTEFERQNGYSRTDYFGNYGGSQRRNYVPCEVQRPDYYSPEYRTRIGHPAHDQRGSMSGLPPELR